MRHILFQSASPRNLPNLSKSSKYFFYHYLFVRFVPICKISVRRTLSFSRLREKSSKSFQIFRFIFLRSRHHLLLVALDVGFCRFHLIIYIGLRGIGGAHRLWASAPPIRRETLFHNNLAAADDVDACGQPVACVIEAIGHAAALQVIYRTVLSVGRLVRRAADAGGLAVEDDRELLGT